MKTNRSDYFEIILKKNYSNLYKNCQNIFKKLNLEKLFIKL